MQNRDHSLPLFLSPVRVPPSGPPNARIMLVGEAPGREEEARGRPFVGASGRELDLMLHEAGIARSDCYVTNFCKHRPEGNDISRLFAKRPQPGYVQIAGRWCHPIVERLLAELHAEVRLVDPDVVVALGDVAMWALCGKSGITAWRGSQLYTAIPGGQWKLVPLLHPAYILRQWHMRTTTVHDLRVRVRAGLKLGRGPWREPEHRFDIRPSVPQILRRIEQLRAEPPPQLAVDLETRGGHIACIGLAWSRTEAMCIPLMDVLRNSGHYFVEPAEELAVLEAVRGLLLDPRQRIVGQNFVYDLQYLSLWLQCLPRVNLDTMVAHHVLYPGTAKGLDVLSSLYCEFHRYWKSEGKEWDARMPEEQLWEYNCRDCVVTYEVAERLRPRLEGEFAAQWQFFMHRLYPAVVWMMLWGLRRDERARNEVRMDLLQRMSELEQWFAEVWPERAIGVKNPRTAKPWWRSPKQLATLFYDVLGVKPVLNRKSGRPTTDDDALRTVAKREPLLAPICERLVRYRSMGVYVNTFLEAQADPDGRIRTQLNPAGTETFRFSSTQTAFGRGANLQNIPRDDDTGELPSIRRLFVPDPGYVLLECDLDRADLQVVVWEADDQELKQRLRSGEDLHMANARDIWGEQATKRHRQLAKGLVHATNYGASPKALARNFGITEREARFFHERWLALHPGIRQWHQRTLEQLMTSRQVRNKFGFRRLYFDRIDSLLPEALAWQPQSTVALVIDWGLVRVFEELPQVIPLLQVHDSLLLQVPMNLYPAVLPRLRDLLLVRIPYDDPLIIPVGCKASVRSWADAIEVDWHTGLPPDDTDHPEAARLAEVVRRGGVGRAVL